ncbi:phage tail protein [Martelella alba]|uniref:Phage tail protein n=1 Tax=Martelella alba TaxID=2590451 RepID=A0ABY2SS04_9HYPH|nr:phage tail protein [Martelella alba]TKI08665.1 phage tail protein [Martelella alba]
MALEEYVGPIVLYMDGQEIEVTDVRTQTNTGRKLVKTMNSTGRAKGFAQGIADYQLTVTVVIPKDVAEPDWDAMEGSKLTMMDLEGNPLYSYLDCFTTQTGEQYTVDNEARRDLTVQALRKVKG